MTRYRAILVVALLAELFACTDSISLWGPGLHLQLRVTNGQLQRGDLGKAGDGPAVSQVVRPQPLVRRGEGAVVLRGRLAEGGVALHIKAVGDPDHWVLGAKGFDFVVADELQWKAELEISYAVPGDTLVLQLQAADKHGRLGPIVETSLTIAPDVPAARLMIALGWDAPVDLDLHVRTPEGVVIGAKNPNSYEPPPPGQVDPPDAWMQGGWLDYDSNQHCKIDMRNRENIIWLNNDPPAGRYAVYAQLYSACGRSVVNLETVVWRDSRPIARAGAALYEFDARVHPRDGDAPGLLLLEVDIQ